MKDSMLKQVAELPGLDSGQLKERWRALYGFEPPAYNRAYLVKRLAYRIQELAFGGLSDTARSQLRDALDGDDKDGMTDRRRRRKQKHKAGMPVVGTRLVREWRGDRYEVTVLDDGFEFEGQLYRSLSAVSKVITGSHTSGPSFFGLRENKRKGAR